MRSTALADRLSPGGLRQRLLAEPTTVQECAMFGESCWWDTDCCPGRICEYFRCIYP